VNDSSAVDVPLSSVSVPRTVGLLMADVVGSTPLYEKLGDSAARRMVHGCLALLEQGVARHKGRTVKSLGDGILCTFPSALQAALAAQAMAEATATYVVAVRIAAHWGDVLDVGGDVFGDAVNTVARILSLATPGEVLVTRSLRDSLPQEAGLWSVRPLPPVTVKGKREPVDLFALVQPTSGMTTLRSTEIGGGFAMPVCQGIVLSLGSLEVQVDTDHPADLGRDPTNTLVVDHGCVSRFHARVVAEGQLVMLQDRSSNGTWVVPDGQAPLQILRRQTPLLGCGRIYLGADPRVNLTRPVIFRAGGRLD